MASPGGTQYPRRAHFRLHRRRNLPESSDSIIDSNIRGALSLGNDQASSTVPVPAGRVELVRRATDSCSDSSSSKCGPPSVNTTSIAIAIGVVVPVVAALVIFIYLHRRHVRRLRSEDANDKHKSLDFGMDPTKNPGTKKKGRQQEMTLTTDPNFERSLRAGRGMSLDMGNPYMLPPEMHKSRESLHSLSRSAVHGTHDPYKLATSYPSGSPTIHSSKAGEDDSSDRTVSTGKGFHQDGMNQNLLRNAQRMSQSGTPHVSSPDSAGSLQNKIPPPGNTIPRKGINPPQEKQLAPPSSVHDSHKSVEVNALRQSSNYLAAFIHSRDPSIDKHNQGEQRVGSAPEWKESRTASMDGYKPMSPPNASSPPTLPQIAIEREFGSNQNPYNEFNEIVVPPAPDAASRATRSSQPSDAYMASPAPSDAQPFYTPTEAPEDPVLGGLGVSEVDFESKRLSIMRPLPPDDPNDNPEQRANRIRSFYKEYFSENEPARAFAPAAGDYMEDYGQEYLGDGAIFDPSSGQFIVAQAPFAEPVTRRAMTPPPRGPPRFQGPRHRLNSAASGPINPRSRAFSSASTSRMGPGPRGPAKRPAPPPTPLRTLPTPHQLKEDAFALPIDFAPPTNFRDQQAGRPQSPMSQLRPYSPSVPVASPLASSYHELSVMPSPHQLRKSGLFTALDFAPPPRFRNADNASDAGSIRSGRSNGSAMSAAQIHSIRAGAYRVSRIPKELVGTKDEIGASLKPSWKVGS